MEIVRMVNLAVAFIVSSALVRIEPLSDPLPNPFPSRICAPYVACWTSLSVSALASRTGNKFYTLAFIISDNSANSAPYWNGTMPMSDDKYVADISTLRAQGGDVIISFGGQGGKELALVHSKVSTLQAAYQQVLSKYNPRWVDFDIEGATIFDTAANTRRNQALRNLQAANPGLIVAYTVPSTSPDSGITQSTLKLLENAKANGVDVGIVNIMAMNYGTTICGDMGQYAINVASHTRTQLNALGIPASVGITPMIGVNDYPCENFTLADTRTVLNYANANSYIGLLSFWVMDADAKDANVNIFKSFNGSVAINPVMISRSPWAPQTTGVFDFNGRVRRPAYRPLIRRFPGSPRHP